MVCSSCIRFHDAFHFQLEKEGGEGTGRETGLHGDDILAKVIGGLQDIDDALLVGAEVREELALNAVGASLFKRRLILPTHILNKVGGRGDEAGPTTSDEVVAALTVRRTHGTGKSKDIAVILFGDARGDESTASARTLHKDRGIAETRRDAVAPHEVELVGLRARHILGDEASMADHLVGGVAVSRRIKRVEAVRQDGNGLHAIG